MPRSSEADGDAGSVRSFTTSYSEATTAGGEPAGPGKRKKYKFVKRFAYQKFEGWRPILTPRHAEIFFLSIGVLLLALGVPILVASLNVVEVKVPYAFRGPFAGLDAAQRQQLLWDAGDAGVTYDLAVPIDKRMEPPVYVVYELGTYFQNFRRYVRSYDPTRMHDGASSGDPASACAPFAYLNDDDSKPINPCGSIAQSFFNDTFSFAAGGAPLAVDSSSIAWASDKDNLYGDVQPENYNPGGVDAPIRGGNTSELALNQNQHWMVWMRPHSQVAPQKLWGRIDVPLEAGSELTVRITNKYNTYNYNGAKTVIVTTNSWVGGRNNFLGAAYIVVGGLCLLGGLAFFLAYDLNMVWKRPYGDLSNLSWLRKEAGDLAQQDAMLAVDAALPTGPSGGSTPADGTPDGLASLGAAAANGNGAPPPKN